jgi:hypothetical protein
MQPTREEVDAMHAEAGCSCCGRKLNPKTMAWLELNFKTGRWSKPGECPEDESQGLHAFGAACARATLRKQDN